MMEAGVAFEADAGGLCGVSAFLFVLSVSTPRLQATHCLSGLCTAWRYITPGFHPFVSPSAMGHICSVMCAI